MIDNFLRNVNKHGLGRCCGLLSESQFFAALTASGLILTSNSKEKPQRGKVIAVGEGKYDHGKLIPVSVKPGDTVIYGKYGGQDVTVDGEEYVILRADDLYAVVD